MKRVVTIGCNRVRDEKPGKKAKTRHYGSEKKERKGTRGEGGGGVRKVVGTKPRTLAFHASQQDKK